jgi:hypothetical protein
MFLLFGWFVSATFFGFFGLAEQWRWRAAFVQRKPWLCRGLENCATAGFAAN